MVAMPGNRSVVARGSLILHASGTHGGHRPSKDEATLTTSPTAHPELAFFTCCTKVSQLSFQEELLPLA